MPQTLLSLPPAVAAFWRENSGNLPSSFPQALRTPGVFCGNDPEDRKLGSGGGTVNLLHQAWRADNARTPIPFSRWLRADKRLVLHAGGQSRRLPGYAAAGKAFLPLPLREGLPFARFQQTLCDLQVPLYLETLDEAGPGAAVLIASGDVWLDFDSTSIPSLSADFTGVGMRVSPEKASDFGVFYVSRGRVDAPASKPFDRFLQKPSAETTYGLLERYEHFVDTGLWFLSAPAVELLFAACGWNETAQRFDTPDGLPAALDFYGEVCAALGAETQSNSPFAGCSAEVVDLDAARFFHLGTSRQVFESLDELQESRQHLRQTFHAAFTPSRPTANPPKDAPVWVDGVRSTLPAFEGNNFLSVVPAGASLRNLGRNQCLETLPVRGGRWGFRAYAIDDAFRGPVGKPSTTICGIPAPEWLDARGLALEAGTDVFQAPVFPLLREEELTQDWLDWFFAAKPAPEVTRRWLDAERVSAEALSARLDARAYFDHKTAALRDCLKVLVDGMLAAYEPSVWNCDFRELASLLRTLAPNQADRLVAGASSAASLLAGTVHGARFQAFLSILGGDDASRARAFAVLREAALRMHGGTETEPVCRLKEDQIVWARSPVRLDLAGGWTDTPPQCFEQGGAVLNAAVLLNGQPPIQVFVRRRREFSLKIHSIDLGISEEIRTYGELDTFRNPESGFSLPKCALALAGFLPGVLNGHRRESDSLEAQLRRFGSGLEVSLLSAVPKGSGLGTSSILATTILAALSRACGLDWDRVALFRKVLVVEQLLTTGGGWQDQAGALFPGLKLVETNPGFAQIPGVRYLPGHLLGPEHANRSILLYYTGVTRLAKNILKEIVSDMFLRRAETQATLGRIRRNAQSLFTAFQKDDPDGMSRCIARSWALNKALDSGTTTPEIEAILGLCGSDLEACKLLGAGGGGYLLLLARDAEAGERIRRCIEAHPVNPRARFIDFTLADEGLKVTVS